ncbi:MAG TPA: N-acetylmuramoyl-L-alanine amidase [Firmicutes bacterium]|nr:N-acetylmuramoyl-L-alanine amidase [Bacillota bacterium]
MAYTYKVMNLDKTTYNLKYKYGEAFTPTQITYHQTANNAPALNERNYLNSRMDNSYIGFHLVVDDADAIECIPLNVQTWHAGDGYGDGNMKSIGVEMAYSTSTDISKKDAAIENGALLIANLMLKYNIPLTLVQPHQARSGKNCPHDILGRYGHDKFRALIQSEYDKLVRATTTQNSTSSNTTSSTTTSTTNKPGTVTGSTSSSNSSSSSSTLSYAQFDTVKLSASTPGYTTSTDTKSAKTFTPGTYKVYKYVSSGKHPLNISESGEAPDAWIDLANVTKTSSDYSQGDKVVLKKSTPGYLTSEDTKTAKTFSAGTYKVYKYVKGASHELNISVSGTAPDAWIDVEYVSTQSNSTVTSSTSTSTFKQGDKVILSKSTPGYLTSTDTKSAKTFSAGTYKVYKYVSGADHELNISESGTAPDAWVDVESVKKSTEAFSQGDTVTVSKSIPGYLSSTDTKAAKTFTPGTYKVYRYVKGATHEVNISTSATTPDAWVDAENLK